MRYVTLFWRSDSLLARQEFAASEQQGISMQVTDLPILYFSFPAFMPI
jgi:hypothetical protein